VSLLEFPDVLVPGVLVPGVGRPLHSQLLPIKVERRGLRARWFKSVLGRGST
jgi:hypothetical protein